MNRDPLIEQPKKKFDWVTVLLILAIIAIVGLVAYDANSSTDNPFSTATEQLANDVPVATENKNIADSETSDVTATEEVEEEAVSKCDLVLQNPPGGFKYWALQKSAKSAKCRVLVFEGKKALYTMGPPDYIKLIIQE